MKKTLFVLGLLAALATAPAFAADPIVGSWTLDTAKSKLAKSDQPTSGTRTYSESGGTYSLDQTLVGADGKEHTTHVQYKEGEDQKMPGAATDSVHAKKVNDRTWDFEFKKDGKVVGHAHRVVSKDGKTLTVHNTGMQPNGRTGNETFVFTRK